MTADLGQITADDRHLGLMPKIASGVVLEEAYDWLCRRRRDASPNDDVWSLRQNWNAVKSRLQNCLLSGLYLCGPTRRVRTREGTFELWSAEDALVLKATALVMRRELDPVVSQRCFHISGRGGLKGAVREVDAVRVGHEFCLRTDVRSYYASIDHEILFDRVKKVIRDPRVLRLIWSYMQRLVCEGGEYTEVRQGIGHGSPLSPLMGALYLQPLDEEMQRRGVAYVRHMDDWVVFAETRWKLRRLVGVVNRVLETLKVEKHPDKTSMGRTDRGFDFLGYRFAADGLRLAAQTKERFVERINRLYEQGAATGSIGRYVGRWMIWVRSGGLGHIRDTFVGMIACKQHQYVYVDVGMG
jgi:RNA-directed DNA polymerase